MPVTPSTLRMRQLKMSAMYTLPPPSTATPSTNANCARAAGPPSPPKPKPNKPVPAKFEMMPVIRSTLRTRLLSASPK